MNNNFEQDKFRQAALTLAWATKADIEPTLRRCSYLQSQDANVQLTSAIQSSPDIQERVALIAVRSFLENLRQERSVEKALQMAGCLPLAKSCPVLELLSQAGKMDPFEQEKITRKILTQVRLESEFKFSILSRYFLGEALYRKPGAEREPDLREATRSVGEVVQATRNSPDLREIWKEGYQLLGLIWEDLAEANLPKNAQEAIDFFEAALKNEDWNAASREQARLMHSLGYLYSMRPTANRYESIETGIRWMREALKVMGDQYPMKAALVWNDLGNAFIERIAGEPYENYHQSLEFYAQARSVHESDPMARERLADVKYNASVACRVLAQHIYVDAKSESCLADGIQYANAAGDFYWKSSNMRMWAKVQSELGQLHYYHRANRDAHIQQAIAHLEAALEKIDRQLEPVHWGNTHDSLANAYSESEQGDLMRNLAKAIDHYHQALEVFHTEDYPQHWANVQNNLGATYEGLGRPDLARDCYKEAFRIRKAERLPNETRQTASNLGNLEFFRKNWWLADQAYSKALDAAERLYQASYTEAGKKTEQSKRFLLTQRAAYAAVMRESSQRALLILEQNKTRLLYERMQNREERPQKVPTDVWKKYQAAAGRVRGARLPEATPERPARSFTEEMEASAADMQALRDALKAVQENEPDFLKEIIEKDLCSVIHDSHTALVAFCVTEVGSIGLILTQSGRVQSKPVSSFTLQRLHTWLHGQKEKGGASHEEGWLEACEKQRLGRMKALLDEIGHDLVEPVLSKLDPVIDKMDPAIDRLLILPTGGLYLVPFHAVPLQARGGRVIDHFEVVYSPSIKVMLKNRSQNSTKDDQAVLKHRALAVLAPEATEGNPELTLFYAEFLEIALKRLDEGLANFAEGPAFPHRKTTPGCDFRFLLGSECTRERMLAEAQDCTELHFYGHGAFYQHDPLQSTLLLANGDRLTLGELQKQSGDLSSIRLLTLLACESGIPETDELPEEYVSLPGGFMQAGVPCVISALWRVNERSSVLLLAIFYEYLHLGNDPALALRKAQKQLRDITYKQLLSLPIIKDPDAGSIQGLRRNFEKEAKKDPDGRPFKHPYHWAAFTVNGYLRDLQAQEDQDTNLKKTGG